MDPLENFTFRVKWDNQYIAGVSKVGALRRVTEDVQYRQGGGDTPVVRDAPGRTRYEPITLERGITSDRAFEQWANLVLDLQAGQGAANYRKDVILDVFNEAGQKVLSYMIRRCWVSDYQALPVLDANANVIAVEQITLENEGWERDAAVVWPPN
ncbi:MAG: phage tail protein [Candidatus Eremiobacteraeota bacterium]|nr:phage tail protein [Candidatus Eremiobacteraeota bacterium]